MEDNRIVDLYWQRDESAISETAVKYGKYLNSISYQILLNAEDAEECVNDTYNDAWQSIQSAPEHSIFRLQSISEFLFSKLVIKGPAVVKYRSKRVSVIFNILKKTPVPVIPVIVVYYAINNSTIPKTFFASGNALQYRIIFKMYDQCIQACIMSIIVRACN